MKEAMVSSVDLPSNVGIHDGHHCVSRAVPQVVVHGEEDKSGGETPEPNHAVPQFVEHYTRVSMAWIERAGRPGKGGNKARSGDKVRGGKETELLKKGLVFFKGYG